jgi:hypothetical protein
MSRLYSVKWLARIQNDGAVGHGLFKGSLQMCPWRYQRSYEKAHSELMLYDWDSNKEPLERDFDAIPLSQPSKCVCPLVITIIMPSPSGALYFHGIL